MGYWRFARPLQVGDELIFEDMIHYTTVKTNMFNGIHHPSLCLLREDGTSRRCAPILTKTIATEWISAQILPLAPPSLRLPHPLKSFF